MPKRILIAEDEESIVACLEFQMCNAGYATRVRLPVGETVAP